VSDKHLLHAKDIQLWSSGLSATRCLRMTVMNQAHKHTAESLPVAVCGASIAESHPILCSCHRHKLPGRFLRY